MSYNSGGMPIGGQFAISSPVPLDCRYVVTSADELTALISEGGVYDGLEVWFTQSITYNSTTYSAGKHVLLSDGTIKCLYKKPSSTSNTSLLEDLDSSSTEASSGSFLTQITVTDGKITNQKTASNAATASKWKDARTITLTGDVTSSAVSIDGSQNISISTTVTDDSHNHVISNVDGLSDALDGKALKPSTATADKDRPIILGGNSNNDSWDATTLYYANSKDSASKKITANPGTGQINATSFNATSDARLKENFESLVLEKSILDLPTYKFDFINGAKNQIGCKAQDLQEICPEIVNEGSDGYLSIQESKIVYLLLEEVKKLRQELDELKKG